MGRADEAKTFMTYERPLDRPSRIWCRVCAEYKISNTTDDAITGASIPIPNNIRTLRCKKCSAVGAVVWEYKETEHELALRNPKKKGWEPLRGNPNCRGECDNSACVPPERISERKQVEKEDTSSSGGYVILLGGICIGWLLRWYFY